MALSRSRGATNQGDMNVPMTEITFNPPRDTGVSLVFSRKPANLDEVTGRGDKADCVYVMKQVILSAGHFDAFTCQLLARCDWLRGLGGYHADGRLCVEVTAPERPLLYVDPQGYDYARAVAIAS